MSVSQTVQIGPYAICRHPRWVGGDCPFDDWIQNIGEECIIDVTDAGEDLVEGARVFVANTFDDNHITVSKEDGSMEPEPIHPEARSIEKFKVDYAAAINQLRANWSEVEIKYGVLAWVS